ncbi:MAG: XrtA system polysaccharide chain length determinant [Geminicoccaceae bacterium]
MQQFLNLITPLLTALWHWRWPSLAVAWFVCLLGWSVIALLPDRYTVSARVVVDTETILGPLMEDLAVTRDFDSQVKMIRQTLFSVPNVVELIAETGIDQHRNVDTETKRAKLIEDLQREISLSIEGRNLFIIEFTEDDPDVALSVVETMMDIFIDRNQGHSQRDVAKASKFIEEQIAIYDEKLRTADLKVAEFKREHADELGGAEQNARELERATSELRRLRSETEAALWRRDQLKVRLDTTPKTISPSQSPGATSDIQNYLEELARKRLLYTEQHPDIIALKQLIAQANRQRQADRESGGLASSGGIKNPIYDQLVSQLEVAVLSLDDFKRRLKVAELEVDALSKKTRQSPKAEADLKRLTRDYDVLLTQYEKLIKRREATQLATDLDINKQRAEYRIVDPPVRPLEPSGPLHGLLIIAVLILGFGAAGAFAVLRFLMTGTVLTATQLQGTFKMIPVLGGVMTAPRSRQQTTHFMGQFRPASAAMGLVVMCGLLVYFYEISTLTIDDVLPSAELAEFVADKVNSLFASKQASAGL